MRKVGGGGLVLAGAFLIFLGIMIRWDFLKTLLDLLGLLVMFGGGAVGIVGLIKMFSGGGKSSYDDDF